MSENNVGLPSFTEAVATFSAFLKREGVPGEVVWVCRKNVTSHRKRLWLYFDDADQTARVAEGMYEAGRRKGLGVSLRGLCRVGSSTACYVWVPEDGVDATYAMQARGLKYEVPKPLLEATEVRSRVYWFLLRLLNRYRRYGDTLVQNVPEGLPPGSV